MVLIGWKSLSYLKFLPCFRPLAGIMVLIDNKDADTWNNTPQRFPSPCGDYGSYQKNKLGSMEKAISQFPSPCGDYGSYH